MDPDREEAEVFSDPEDPFALTAEDKEQEEDEVEEDDDEEDARIFNAWMQRYRGGEQQSKVGEEEKEDEDDESEGGRLKSRSSPEPPAAVKLGRRASLPCPVRTPVTVQLQTNCKVQ